MGWVYWNSTGTPLETPLAWCDGMTRNLWLLMQPVLSRIQSGFLFDHQLEVIYQHSEVVDQKRCPTVRKLWMTNDFLSCGETWEWIGLSYLPTRRISAYFVRLKTLQYAVRFALR
jgi:hypothetical protein